MKKKLNELQPGERFDYGGVNWTLLELKGEEAICISSTPVLDRAFDKDNRNDWRRSSLRKELNGNFLATLDINGADSAAFMEFEGDLTADDGMTDYGTARDKIALITCDLYREHRALLPKIGCWQWTLTPWTCDPEYSCSVRYVGSSGTMGWNVAYHGDGGVRPLCHLKSDILVSVPDEDAETEQSTSVEQAINDMMKILDERPLELWGEIMGALVAYACRE